MRPSSSRSASFGGLTRSVGAFRAIARTGLTSRGVTMITNSVSSRWNPVERNKRADNRQRAETGQLPDGVLEIAAQQTSHRKGFSVAQLDDGLRAASLQTGDGQIVDDDRCGRIDRADFRRNDHIDYAVGEHRRSEGKAHAERLPLDCKCAALLLEPPPF